MKKSIFISLFLSISLFINAQSLYDTLSIVPATPIKDQQLTGTCWSFGTISFIESEILRNAKLEIDLSEMFIVYHAWKDKSEMYVRMQGENYLTPGGQMHDVMRVIENFGLMPESVFGGYTMGPGHDHSFLDTALTKYLNEISALRYPDLPKDYLAEVETIVTQYLGAPSEKFLFKEKNYNAISYAEMLNFDPNAYITITSYNHHPYYQYFVLEDRYNWSSDLYFNVPPERFLDICDSALLNNYSFVWDGDVSETGFSEAKGKAIISMPENADLMLLRQEMFDDHRTTVDHIMHVIGKLKKYNGDEYYLLKNSWGDIGKTKGYILMSKDFFFLKTVAVMLHKDALPKDIREKTGM